MPVGAIGSGRTAPDDAARHRSAAQIVRGTDQVGLRLYNERLVLSLIRRHGALPRAEIARLTGLSAQTITVIMRELERDGLVVSRGRVRGRIGQPSVPFALNPDGAYSIGLKIGRRSYDLVLVDLVGNVRHAIHAATAYPVPDELIAFVERGLRELVDALSPAEAQRIAGLGIAAPFELWNWEGEIGAPREILDQWRTLDLRARIASLCAWPVFFCNDATAACGAELMIGNPHHDTDFLYFFVGSFIGGGVVLGGGLYMGHTDNAGAIGSMPVPATGGPASRGPAQQLIRSASLYLLAERLAAAGQDPSVVWRSPDAWGDLGRPLDDWIDQAAPAIAYAIVAATAVIDFPAAIVDGAFPAAVRARLVQRIAAEVESFDRQGLSAVTVREGTVGSGARAIGGACLPLLANFARDREVLFKEALAAV